MTSRVGLYVQKANGKSASALVTAYRSACALGLLSHVTVMPLPSFIEFIFITDCASGVPPELSGVSGQIVFVYNVMRCNVV